VKVIQIEGKTLGQRAIDPHGGRLGIQQHFNLLQRLFQILAVNWLGNIFVHSRFETTVAISLHGVRCHGNDR
jgi:hypothetical protein